MDWFFLVMGTGLPFLLVTLLLLLPTIMAAILLVRER
jgi:hypothetical protein